MRNLATTGSTGRPTRAPSPHTVALPHPTIIQAQEAWRPWARKQFSCRKSAGNSRRLILTNMSAAPPGTFSFQVHDGGDRALDGIFRLIALGDEDRPLEEVLTSMCADVAAIARADVA